MGLFDEPMALEDCVGLGGLFEPMELDIELPDIDSVDWDAIENSVDWGAFGDAEGNAD